MPTDPVRQLPGFQRLTDPDAVVFRLPEDDEDEWPDGQPGDPSNQADPESTPIVLV